MALLLHPTSVSKSICVGQTLLEQKQKIYVFEMQKFAESQDRALLSNYQSEGLVWFIMTASTIVV